ncbi:hypothetical protein LC593_13825 [Nostoc sp. CHAB 5844]|nr:hypothetical protein [Nostoc sp. CHAB 5844]
MKLSYEQPKITNYGTMKNLTHASAGSGGDSIANSGTGRSLNENTSGPGIPGRNTDLTNSNVDDSRRD